MTKASNGIHFSDELASVFRLDEPHKKALKRLGIVSVRDLFYHFPNRYDDPGEATDTNSIAKGQKVTLYGTMMKPKASKGWKTKVTMTQAFIETPTGKIKAVWFHQPYIAKMFPEGAIVKVEGTISERGGELYLSNPAIERATVIPESGETLFAKNKVRDTRYEEENGDDLSLVPRSSSLFPVYPETKGVTSRWFYYTIQKAIKAGALDTVVDPIPADMLKRYNLPTLGTALVWMHAPERDTEATAARKRFAFEEIFFIQLAKQQERHANDELPTWDIRPTKEQLDSFLSRFPFTPTSAQSKALKDILADLAGSRAMSRLLEGDVGSGKTFVAAATSFAVVTTRPNKDPLDATRGKQDFGNLQVAVMAPTEILATQHFESFIELYRELPIQVALITSSGCKKFPSKVNPDGWTDISRTQLLKWVANGEIPIVIGTHSLIQKTVVFKHLACVIIDEQHRFGTKQRMALVRRQARTERGQDAEKPDISSEEKLLYKDLTYAIRDCIFRVQKELGSGHKESVYENALKEELLVRNLKIDTQKQIPIFYRNKKVGMYRPDMIVEDKIVIELKALPFVGSKEKRQLWTYLKGSEYRLALLVNFGPKGADINRIVYDVARDKSASSPQQSALIPHLLSMTATPIPRTLALTIYGDLDLSLLDVMPPGRKPIITTNVPPSGRNKVYEHLRQELAAGRQAYVICPRIEQSQTDADATQTNADKSPHNSASSPQWSAFEAKSVEAEATRLAREVFPEFSVGSLHGKMTPKKKEETMEAFTRGDIDILVATSVVEVGVNVPNSTIIVIEGAERFGLSQLHQLRGRVLRSSHQAHCYLFTETKSSHTLERLKALTEAKNGFELAERDLMLRGAGDLAGKKQWGVSDIGMEALKNLKLVEAARTEAKKMIEKDPRLKKYPLLRDGLERRDMAHLE